MSILNDLFGWLKHDNPYHDMGNAMHEAANAVRKQGQKGFLSVHVDPETGFEEVYYTKRKGGKEQHVRMPAVDQLVRMVPGEDCGKVVDFLASETRCARSVRQPVEDDYFGEW